MLTYKIGLSPKEHDDFVKNSSQTNLLQSSQWAKVKDNWDNDIIGFYRDEQLVASAAILIKQLPLGMTMLYIPRGPVMDYTDKELVQFVIDSLKKYGKTKKALFIKFDPAILLRQHLLEEEGKDNKETLEIISTLEQAGASWSGCTIKIEESIQPRYQANVYTQENIEESFPKHTKRLLKKANNRGVMTYRASKEDIDAFADVVAQTEERKGVALRNKEYFKKMMTIFGDDAYLHLAKVNLKQGLLDYEEQLKEIEAQIAQTQPHQKKRLNKLTEQKESVAKYVAEFGEFVKKYPDELVIAGILSIRFGNVMEMLYAGMNDEFKSFFPQYTLYPKVFKDAYQDGIIWANMGGIEGTLDDGLTKFKSNFNPMIEEYIGEFDIPVNSVLYGLSKKAYQIRKQMRSKH
ncbi:aminoacyltransferase [Streptococcus zalophi]|uniref:Aminoacyltransferase n=1 Tax=Streptococcus zalophi TaxID=640031 RepID=A0A934P8Z5_9STRE|nr:aminoacyltransferase [Streptococcus zalophi]MBJ8349161.1 aminoacyltransferase [Streptococcus zalophi]MCR8967217.1 aminoacyltransferase [Streptococcus zalophi]